MRRRLLVAASLVLVVALGLTAAAGAARNPKEPTYRPQPSDLAIARNLLLARADVPARFKLVRPSANDDDFPCARYDPDLSGLVSTAEVEGQTYRLAGKTGLYVVSSMANLFRSTPEANTYWRRGVANRRIGPCLADLFGEGFGAGVTFGNVRVIPVKVAAGDIAVQSWNLVGDLRDGTRTLGKALIEVTLMKRGRALSVIVMFTFGKPLTAEARSLGAAAGRKLALAPVTGGQAA